MPRYAHAVLGGTFDRLHVGHAALLAAAFRAGRRVSVGVTTDAFVRSVGKPGARSIQPYAVRRRSLRRWISAHFPRRECRLVPLSDRYGRSVGPGVDVLVVSAETEDGGRAVNAERRRRGEPSVPIVVVPLVLADDLWPVSSRRIRAGTIDRRGRRIAPLSVGIATDDPADRAVVVAAVRRAWPRARWRLVAGPRGPRRRAAPAARRLAAAAIGRTELALGVARGRAGGWVLVERSRVSELDPVAVRGSSRGALREGVARLLRPRRAQGL
ncbi:MAG TPA: pantetheine-phosphate adenylyltransferase [Thermoplasmata archaeon]|nr:pantetheine-phosphate adenylyltransferase [Thermoplasmata archaeon]